MISYVQAVVIGLLQGVTELFPVSSLGHSVLVPAFLGGSWETLVTQSATSTSETSPYLAVIVALHVATALALIVFFRSDWFRIIRGFGRTLRPSIAARRLVTTDADERLAWLPSSPPSRSASPDWPWNTPSAPCSPNRWRPQSSSPSTG
ncbi:MAG: undecaprenyl-diphosphatase [Mycobacterium sp.]|nr:undecaprenyl-diphosphatase [Mycobacterium sp.]